MNEQFYFKQRLGSGSFGEVWLVTNTCLNADFALKCIPPDRVVNSQNFLQEAQFLKLAEHPNIISINSAGWLPDGRIYLEMEYLKKGSLQDESKGAYVELTRARRIMCDVLRGLEHAHSQGITHRDIKPANILVGDASEGKLSDFGLAMPKAANQEVLSSFQHFVYISHLAPEIKSPSDFTTLSDVYSCGVTLYRLVNGDSYLPSIASHDELRKQIKRGKYPNRDAYRMFIPRSIKMVINKAMSVNPEDRYQTALSMRRALEKISLHLNWKEQTLPEGKKWIAGMEGACYQVIMQKNKSESWDIEVQKGHSKKTLRRIGKLCFKNLSKNKAIIKAKSILQSFSSGDIQ